MYNRLFRETCDREKPDVMIIGMPGGIMLINSYTHELFGETALALTNADRPDVTLMSYYYYIGRVMQDYFEMLQKYACYGLGIKNVYFHSANTKLIEERDAKLTDYLALKSDFVLQNQPNDIQLFNALILESYEPVYQNVIETLQQNICVM